MKAGDLVKDSAVWEVPELRLGLLMEWDVKKDSTPAAGWVLWQGQYDWEIVYEDDIEVISEGR